jgi:hypothetical protein
MYFYITKWQLIVTCYHYPYSVEFKVLDGMLLSIHISSLLIALKI